jgi:hypothetical protein
MKINFENKILQGSLLSLVIIGGLLFFVWASLILVPSLQYSYFHTQLHSKVKIDSEAKVEMGFKALQKDVSALELKMDKLIPGGAYLIINTTDNSFKLYKNKELTRTGICSTGSYIELQDGNNKKWVFETPKGVFTVKGKIVNPIWRKPDWAFAEEGLPIPSATDPSRYEAGVLGDYALSIGNGYLIHGTLYQRFLGLAVTHGCVRLNDSDLEFIYNNMPVGGKVFIY